MFQPDVFRRAYVALKNAGTKPMAQTLRAVALAIQRMEPTEPPHK